MVLNEEQVKVLLEIMNAQDTRLILKNYNGERFRVELDNAFIKIVYKHSNAVYRWYDMTKKESNEFRYNYNQYLRKFKIQKLRKQLNAKEVHI